MTYFWKISTSHLDRLKPNSIQLTVNRRYSYAVVNPGFPGRRAQPMILELAKCLQKQHENKRIRSESRGARICSSPYYTPPPHPLDPSLVNRLNVLVWQIEWISYLVTSVLFTIKRAKEFSSEIYTCWRLSALSSPVLLWVFLLLSRFLLFLSNKNTFCLSSRAFWPSTPVDKYKKITQIIKGSKYIKTLEAIFT